MQGDIRRFGTTADGTEVLAIHLAAGGLRATVLTLGATLQDLRLAGCDHPLVLGSADPDAYGGVLLYAGATVGPVANRIGGGQAKIGEAMFRFDRNEGGITTLHGGDRGIHALNWRIEAAATDEVTLGLSLPDGFGGFPGTRELSVRYRLSAPATLALRMTGQSDAATLLNLAHHSYWNLDGRATVEGHRLTVAADRYLPVTDRLIPTGEQRPVAGTQFDLRAGQTLSQLSGIDHTLCLANGRRALTEVAELVGATGLRLRLATTEPGLQVYDGGHLAVPSGTGLGGRAYAARAGLALEAQGWPDAPNQPGFPPVTLLPGALYRQETRFSFDRI